MKKNKLLESLSHEVGDKVSTRRYNLADMISESYKLLYASDADSNMRKLAESHLADVKSNPRDIERLSRQLCLVKEVSKLVESNELKDEDLVDKKAYDTVEPNEDRVIQTECNESAGDWEAFLDSPEYDEAFEDWYQEMRIPGVDKEDHHQEFQGTTPCEDAYKRWKEDNKVQESIKESDDPELTDEELEELSKHLETIRKERKNAPKTEIEESAPTRRGIKCTMADSKKPEKEELKEENTPHWTAVSFDFKHNGDYHEDWIKDHINKVMDQMGCEWTGYVEFTDVTHNYESKKVNESGEEMIKVAVGKQYMGKGLKPEYKEKYGYRTVEIPKSAMIGSTKFDKKALVDGGYINDDESVFYVDESLSYKGLENFKKQSESKAFYKTFKKMNDALKEGKALTRQESIDLYKASNSALTQLSIELEHNPEFLDTFKESVSLLSKDVTSLLESLTRGKAPSKATMKSLSKFSEALLNEASVFSDQYDDVPGYVTFEEYKTMCADKGIMEGATEDELYDMYLNDCEDNVDETVKYPNGQDVPKDSVDLDKALDYQYGIDRDKDNSKYTDEEKQKAIDYWVKKNDKMYEAEEEDEAPVEETPEEDFVGDDEGDVQSEEADEFDQEYADARVELHKELADEHADDEDPEVQEKIEKDAAEVTNLPGITDEQIAEINGEESSEEGEEEAPEEEPTEDEVDDEEITDDELEELKKHLAEIRAAKK